jgi:hypothetical protein
MCVIFALLAGRFGVVCEGFVIYDTGEWYFLTS